MTPAQERLGRMLAIVPWIAANDGPRVADVCRRFNLTERELVADLELLFLCGVHPFTPDTLIDVDIADGRVWIRFADWFRRPLRLTPPEGLALVSAGATLLAVPGSDPDGALSRALAKLETVLGVAADDAVDVQLGPVAPSILDAVRDGEHRRRKLQLDYYTFGRDDHTRRVVQPWRVFNAAGQWYLEGWCEAAEGHRLFRVDRISAATVLDQPAPEPPAGSGPPAVFQPGPDDPVVVLDLDPDVHWIAEAYPNEGVEARDRSVLRVRLRSAGRAWLERLLLRAGPHASVVEGDTSVGRDAARRVLARYTSADGGGKRDRSAGLGGRPGSAPSRD
ncbi:WYL domain-containing protein [Acidiferrimicrobium sp. IK]|uniref:helix-turn-helix transcriptional regulator n=1 Tax=Acidiferrimicrobium sp. IK TaxID=2871700 RepID=UPI0021CAE399|nr:WYL domain-containing protein [Acidiferrimicrobium sp. IK]MCU4184667.1 WYL domain-containing protein [Acidiferrimicrobium sp. IK]